MPQVECFETNNIWNLEKQINDFLDIFKSDNVLIDIKYDNMSSSLPRESDDDWSVLYTAMVIYSGPKVKRD